MLVNSANSSSTNCSEHIVCARWIKPLKTPYLTLSSRQELGLICYFCFAMNIKIIFTFSIISDAGIQEVKGFVYVFIFYRKLDFWLYRIQNIKKFITFSAVAKSIMRIINILLWVKGLNKLQGNSAMVNARF